MKLQQQQHQFIVSTICNKIYMNTKREKKNIEGYEVPKITLKMQVILLFSFFVSSEICKVLQYFRFTSTLEGFALWGICRKSKKTALLDWEGTSCAIFLGKYCALYSSECSVCNPRSPRSEKGRAIDAINAKTTFAQCQHADICELKET